MLDKQKMFDVPAEPDGMDPWEVYLDLYVEGDRAVAGVALPVIEEGESLSYSLEMWSGDLDDVTAAIWELLNHSDKAYVPSAEVQEWLDDSPCYVVNLFQFILLTGIRKSGDPGRQGVVRDVFAGRMGMASLQVGRNLVLMLLAAEAVHESAVESAQAYLMTSEWVWVDAIVTHYKGQWLLRADGSYQVRIRGNSDTAEALTHEMGGELLDAQDVGGDLLLIFK